MKHDLQTLSAREREVLRLLVRGHDGKSIASALGISVHSVNERLREARRKLGVSSSREAARLLLAQEGGAGAHEKVGDEEIGIENPRLGGVDRDVFGGGATGANRLSPYLLGGVLMIIAIVAAFAVLGGGAGSQSNAEEAGPREPKLHYSSILDSKDYPAEALKRREEGTVGFDVRVTAEGRVANCRVGRSSGSAILDERTCAILLSRGRFVPAADAGGKPIESAYSGKMRWVLPPSTIRQ